MSKDTETTNPITQSGRNELTKQAIKLLSEAIWTLTQSSTHLSVGANNTIQGHVKELEKIHEQL